MPDWRRLVSEKIDRVHLPKTQKEEIAAELGSHLEEVYEEQRRLGLRESEAFQDALSEVLNWAELTRRIQNAKREERIMNDRTKQLWLPGMAGFWLTMACEVALGRLGAGTISGGHLFNPHNTVVYYGVWFLAQLACGALAAYLSKRAGGTRSARVGAALFTSAVLLTTMVIVIAICTFGRATGLAFQTLDFSLLIKPVAMVVVVPSFAMMLGALPFLSEDEGAAIFS